MTSARRYALPEVLGRFVSGDEFSPGELRRVCLEAGEGLGSADAGSSKFRPAAEMVEMWRGLDLPAWLAPYILRDARLGYLKGYERALVSGELSTGRAASAARARWAEGWREKLAAARKRHEGS